MVDSGAPQVVSHHRGQHFDPSSESYYRRLHSNYKLDVAEFLSKELRDQVVEGQKLLLAYPYMSHMYVWLREFWNLLV